MSMGRQVIIAADPGVSGAIAVMIDGALAEVQDMPTWALVIGKAERRRVDLFTLDGLLRSMLTSHVEPLDELMVLVEEVGPRPRDGTVGAFTFGEAYGLLQGVAAGLRVPLRYVQPNRWKKDLKLRRGKDASRQRAQQLFPAYRDEFARAKDDGRAEAALIAHWGHAELTTKGVL